MYIELGTSFFYYKLNFNELQAQLTDIHNKKGSPCRTPLAEREESEPLFNLLIIMFYLF